MTTTTQTLQQQMILPSHSSLSSHVEHAVTLHTMRLLQEAFDGKHGLAGIMRLVLVVAFDSIKALVCEAIGKAFGGASMAKLWTWLVPFFKSILSYKKAVVQGDDNPTMQVVSFLPHASFWRALLVPQRDSCKCTWTVSRRVTVGSRELMQKVLGDMIVTEIWTDIVINDATRGICAHINSPIKLVFTYDTKMAMTSSVSMPEWEPDAGIRDIVLDGVVNTSFDIVTAKGSFRTYLDLVPFPKFREAVSKIVAAYTIKKCNNMTMNTVKFHCGLHSQIASTLQNYFITKVFFHLASILPIADTSETEIAFNQFYIMMAAIYVNNPKLATIVRQIQSKRHSLFGVDLGNDLMNLLNPTIDFHSIDIVKNMPDVGKVTEWLMMQLFPGQCGGNSSSDNGNINVYVHNAADWREFVRVLCAPSTITEKSKSDPVAVHLVQIVDVTTETTRPNPVYAAWTKKNDAENAKENDTVSVAPPETLVTSTVKREVRAERVSSVCKPMDTVYLRRDDQDILMRSLELFRDRKDLVAELGLPHKLGVLLHGPPGTGKSTTIAAIATFLQKDLHYISLGTVKTNTELRKIFDHVTSNCANGGIVVMEDVDAMAPVVLDRSTRPHETCASTTADELTLDFMLNMLQGTMTIDGMVFVATTNHLDHLDPAFYREGRFDVLLRLGASDREQVRAAFARFFGRDPRPEVLAAVVEGVHTQAAVVARLARYLCVKEDDDAVVLAPFCIKE